MEIMTKLVQCSCGNLYNAANHPSCPVCGAGAAPGSQPTGMGGNMGDFGKTVAPGMGSATPTGMGGSVGEFNKTVAPNNAGASQTDSVKGFSETVAPGMGKSNSSGGIGMTRPVSNDYKAGGNQNPNFSPTETIYAPSGAQNMEKNNAVEPVVGWLVCIKGPMRGNDYRIHAGYNTIGREIGDIHIRGDQTISRQNHARIAFEPRSNRFFFSPDSGKNIVYHNNEPVVMMAELRDHDVITIGETELMFISLCGDKFSWNNV